MIVSFSDFLTEVRKRKAQLGFVDTPERVEAMRNDGSRRTESKRAMLTRIDERARNAGVAPLKANY